MPPSSPLLPTALPPQIPLILVGNKQDLSDFRQVSTDEAMEKARAWKAPYYETSAKTGVRVDHVYQELMRLIRRRKQKKEARAQRRQKRQSKMSCCVM